jgi:hypothetical protein
MMPNEPIEQIVIEQALASRSHLAVACAVRQSFDTILKTVVGKFLQQLTTELTNSLGPTWKITAKAPETSQGEHLVFMIGKKNCFEYRRIVLGMYGSPSKAFMGILRVQPVSPFSEKDDEDLRANLATVITSSIKTDREWVGWWDVKHNTYSSWNSKVPDALCDMYYDTFQVVGYFKEAIQRCARTVEPIMDRCYPMV